MSNVEARIKIKGNNFEIIVDLDEALKVKKGQGDIRAALLSQSIYYDLKKGTLASKTDLQEAFNTLDVFEIAKKIVVSGEVQRTQEYRDEEREKKIKQVIAIILKNATDQNGRPFTEERLKRAIEETHYSFDSRPAEKQMPDLLNKLKEVIPIKIETKRIRIIVPAQYTGHVYGLLQEYKESEEWLDDGKFKVILNVPAGILNDFFCKLNSATHGTIQSEELGKE